MNEKPDLLTIPMFGGDLTDQNKCPSCGKPSRLFMCKPCVKKLGKKATDGTSTSTCIQETSTAARSGTDPAAETLDGTDPGSQGSPDMSTKKHQPKRRSTFPADGAKPAKKPVVGSSANLHKGEVVVPKSTIDAIRESQSKVKVLDAKIAAGFPNLNGTAVRAQVDKALAEANPNFSPHVAPKSATRTASPPDPETIARGVASRLSSATGVEHRVVKARKTGASAAKAAAKPGDAPK